MNRLWEIGLEHYWRGNHYAARDLWNEVLKMELTREERIAVYNSLGAVVRVLNGPKEALEYFEQVVRIVEQEHPADPRHAKYLANLAITQVELDMSEAAIAAVRKAAQLVQAEPVDDPLHVVYICLSVLGRYELQSEALRYEADIRSYLERCAKEPSVDRKELAKCYHGLGKSHLYAHNADKAYEYYQKALEVCELPETLQEMARLSVLRGEPQAALDYASRLKFENFWQLEILLQKMELADTLSLIGTFAYYAKHRDLFYECIEKAELYYGQLLHWRQWGQTQELRETLPAIDVEVPVDALDWERWQAHLKELSLLDSLESMFPNLYRWSEIANHLTVRLVRRLVPDGDLLCPALRVAGRLVYLGMTAIAETEAEAIRRLHSKTTQSQVCEYGERVLETFPEAASYRTLVRHYRNPLHPDVREEQRILAQCVGVAVEFVEGIELNQWTHAEAVSHILNGGQAKYDALVLDAFRQETVVDL